MIKKTFMAFSLFSIISLTQFQSSLAEGQLQTGITTLINGQAQSFEVQPFLENGRIMVPLGLIGLAIGANVVWDTRTKSVMLEAQGINITLPVGSKESLVNGSTVTLDVPAMIQNGRVFVPLRFVSENFNYDVTWNPLNKQVSLNLKDSAEKTVETIEDITQKLKGTKDGLIDKIQKGVQKVEGITAEI